MHPIETSPSPEPDAPKVNHYDVVILGAGLAGLALARHLLLDTDKTILLLERRDQIPPRRQKVGESSVQVAGFYYGRVLDLEEYLWLHQFMKYNLRFYWKTPGRDTSRFEEYCQSYIRNFSNIPSYQLDRNTFEGELLRRNLENPRFTFRAPARDLAVTLSETGDEHSVRYTYGGATHTARSTWLVDTSGRGKVLARRKGLERRNPIRHGAFWWWVDGLVDIDRLTDLPQREIRKKPQRRQQGHLPSWLATNHFCEEGLWFWVIPLQGKTSLGLVFDKSVINHHDVFSVEKATAWVCEHFPCFARDLPQRKVLDFSGLADYSFDCAQTLSATRWALAGEAGRFTDPLYSPGSDLISIYNTLIVDAIKTDDAAELAQKCQIYEQVMRAVYQAYVPSYANSYDALGDQETFALKYTWELSVYFATYVFPFINDLFTDRRFLLTFLRIFSRLGPVNYSLQTYLSAYFHWKKANVPPLPRQIFHDFMSLEPLARTEKTFYEVGVTVEEAKVILNHQLHNLEELARYVVAYVASRVLGDERVLTNRRFVESLDVSRLAFDPEALRVQVAGLPDDGEPYGWSFDPWVFRHFTPLAEAAAEAEGEAMVEEVVG